ncbi:MAG TPA: hypothetical protein VGW38_20675, partial [Chloroflexota bacterium]|nr:hypothetical protein [Chloroflexota bacterium]
MGEAGGWGADYSRDDEAAATVSGLSYAMIWRTWKGCPLSDLLETYLRDLRDIRRSGAGTRETSSYPALAQLLTGVGRDLRPKVQAVLQLANQGAGLPDGGLFTADQLRGSDENAPLRGQTPARGVIEVKGTGEDIDAVANSEQVARYLERYGLVLVTNYRDLVLVDRDPDGTRDVAFFLASYARDANARIAHRGLPSLTTIREALEQALGIRFEGERGEHFFRSTLVQTLFYGIFSAWVLWSKGRPFASTGRFDWRAAQWTL